MRVLIMILLMLTNVAHAADQVSPKTSECQGSGGCPVHQAATSPKTDEHP